MCLCVLVVSSHGSLGAGDKQSGVGYKVGPSQTPLSAGGGDSQWPQLLSRQRGEKSSPFKTGEFIAVCSKSAFVRMPRLERGDGGGTGGTGRTRGEGILFVLVENMSLRAGKKEEVEEKITTRMDGGSTERRNNRREHELGA